MSLRTLAISYKHPLRTTSAIRDDLKEIYATNLIESLRQVTSETPSRSLKIDAVKKIKDNKEGFIGLPVFSCLVSTLKQKPVF